LGRHLALSLDDLKALEQRLADASEEERAALPGLSALRADTLLPGTVVLRTLLELTGYPGALVCESALKEGLVVNYFAHRMRAWLQTCQKRSDHGFGILNRLAGIFSSNTRLVMRPSTVVGPAVISPGTRS